MGGLNRNQLFSIHRKIQLMQTALRKWCGQILQGKNNVLFVALINLDKY